MIQPPMLLGAKERLEVGQAIRDHCAVRSWTLHQHNVRTNHVHVVVTAPTHSPEQAMAQFKSWGTRRLMSAGLLARGRKVWSDHGSTLWINDRESLDRVIVYVREMQ
jgi:REP element-mobilizing transposase RayT